MACDDILIDWGYSGSGAPENWGNLSADYRPCADGIAQSPVDIAGYVAGDLPPVVFHYNGSAVGSHNTGKSAYLDYGPGNAIDVGGHRYELQGIHYHSPGEHLLDGESFGAELHLVHQDNLGSLAVVGLLFRSGAASPLVQALLDAAPNPGESVAVASGIAAAEYVPTGLGYFGYDGSLTTPPCSEGVRWIVMQEIGTVSPPQIAALQSLSGGPNNRPVQDIGTRRIVSTTAGR